MKDLTLILIPALAASLLLIGCNDSSSSDNNSTDTSSSSVTSSSSSSTSSSSIETVFLYAECDEEGATAVTASGQAAICSGGHWQLDTTSAAPVLSSNPMFTTDSVVTVNENSTFVIDVNISEEASSVVYAIAGGDDNESFEINATTGELSFISAPDFESKQNYDVSVSAGDNAGHSATQALNIIVLDVEENGL